jgi:hypothetical protein
MTSVNLPDSLRLSQACCLQAACVDEACAAPSLRTNLYVLRAYLGVAMLPCRGVCGRQGLVGHRFAKLRLFQSVLGFMKLAHGTDLSANRLIGSVVGICH